MRLMDLRFIKYIMCITVAALILSSPVNSVAYAAEKAPKSPGPEETPYYSKYKFVKSDNYLNVGVQPLYLPSGMITTVMSRDLILQRRLENMGITIVFYSFLKGMDVNKFFLGDDLQSGVVGDMPAVTAASKKDVFIPAIMQRSFTSIVARRNMFINKLRGRRIGNATDSTAHYTLLKTLSYEGITEKDVKLVPMEITEMPGALSKKDIFAFSAWEPIVGLTQQNYPESVVIHRTLTFGYLYFSKEFYLKHPEAVRQVVAAEIRAVRWIKATRENLVLAGGWTHESIRLLMGDKLKISPEQISDIVVKDMMWQSDAPVIPEKNLIKNGTIASTLEFLKSQGKIDSSVSIEKVIGSFDRALVYDVLSMPDKYGLNDFNYDLKADR